MEGRRVYPKRNLFRERRNAKNINQNKKELKIDKFKPWRCVIMSQVRQGRHTMTDAREEADYTYAPTPNVSS